MLQQTWSLAMATNSWIRMYSLWVTSWPSSAVGAPRINALVFVRSRAAAGSLRIRDNDLRSEGVAWIMQHGSGASCWVLAMI